MDAPAVVLLDVRLPDGNRLGLACEIADPDGFIARPFRQTDLVELLLLARPDGRLALDMMRV